MQYFVRLDKHRYGTYIQLIVFFLIVSGLSGTMPESSQRGNSQWRNNKSYLTVLILPEKTTRKITKKQKKKPGKCCKFGIAYRSGGGLVVLESLCRHPDKTVVRLRTIRLSSVCTHPVATVIKDRKGRIYPMISHHGLRDCRQGLTRKPELNFEWVFAPLPENVHNITIVERTSVLTSGYYQWIWRNIDLRTCRKMRSFTKFP